MLGMGGAMLPLALIALECGRPWLAELTSSSPEPTLRRLGAPSGGYEELMTVLAIIFFACVGAIITSTVASIVFACMYKSKVVDERGTWQPSNVLSNGDFRKGTFSCFDDTQICLHACCCPSCRAGDTYQTIGDTPYWTVIAMFTAAQIGGHLIGELVTYLLQSAAPDDSPAWDPQQKGQNVGNLAAALITGALFTSHRRKLRELLGGSKDDPSCFMDFVCYSFCTSCVIAQEAWDVDDAMQQTVECCCKLESKDQPLVGQPVNVGQ